VTLHQLRHSAGADATVIMAKTHFRSIRHRIRRRQTSVVSPISQAREPSFKII
jgi:hypothetical protein